MTSITHMGKFPILVVRKKFVVLVPAALLALLAGGYLLSKNVAPATRSLRSAVRGSVEETRVPEGTPPVETRRPTVDRQRPSGSGSELIDRLLVGRDPGEFGPVAEELSRAELGEQDLERLRTLARSGAMHLRVIAVHLLATRPDPDGKNLDAIRDACAASEEMVAHDALTSLARYVQANPSAAETVQEFLLDRARSSSDEERRQLAASTIEFDRLTPAQRGAFDALLRDGSEEVRCAALYALSQSSRRADSRRLLADTFASDPSERVKRHVVELLAEMGRESRETLLSLKGRFPALDSEIDEAMRGWEEGS